jgi:hypothetical protein
MLGRYEPLAQAKPARLADDGISGAAERSCDLPARFVARDAVAQPAQRGLGPEI